MQRSPRYRGYFRQRAAQPGLGLCRFAHCLCSPPGTLPEIRWWSNGGAHRVDIGEPTEASRSFTAGAVAAVIFASAALAPDAGAPAALSAAASGLIIH